MSRDLKREAARCARMLLDGKVTCDHFLEEFGGLDDPEIRRIVDIVRAGTEAAGRYRRMSPEEKAAREKIAVLIESLEAGTPQ